MELTYSPARPEDGPVIFGFAKELIERYETDPALDLVPSSPFLSAVI